jgi:uncharacterized protein YdeI (YjbR/CyaY-like superfamily)
MSSAQNPKVQWYFDKERKWQAEFKQLRVIALDSGLIEDLKWGHPCYSLNGNNIFLMHGFNNYCALLFMKGALIEDSEGILVQQTENVQSARQIRFTGSEQIATMHKAISDYIAKAIKVETSGKKVDFVKNTELIHPEEFQILLDENSALKDAFELLTPGRQRAYNLYFTSAKQSKTRVERIEKYLDRIMDGLGIDD